MKWATSHNSLPVTQYKTQAQAEVSAFRKELRKAL